jgi:hypothetical protein
MLGKLLVAGGVLATLPVLPCLVPQPTGQDPAPAVDSFHQEARWNFAVLQYTSAAGKSVEIAASSISKIWVLATHDGELSLEILYENSDYTYASVREFHVIRRSATYTSVDVPIVRTTAANMAFPAFKK